MQLWKFKGKIDSHNALSYEKKKTLPLEPFDEETSITNMKR